jgi:hypothetical protein
MSGPAFSIAVTMGSRGVKQQTTNLGIMSSNLFGRAISCGILCDWHGNHTGTGESGLVALRSRISGFDPGCVKTRFFASAENDLLDPAVTVRLERRHQL